MNLHPSIYVRQATLAHTISLFVHTRQEGSTSPGSLLVWPLADTHRCEVRSAVCITFSRRNFPTHTHTRMSLSLSQTFSSFKALSLSVHLSLSVSLSLPSTTPPTLRPSLSCLSTPHTSPSQDGHQERCQQKFHRSLRLKTRNLQSVEGRNEHDLSSFSM